MMILIFQLIRPSELNSKRPTLHSQTVYNKMTMILNLDWSLKWMGHKLTEWYKGQLHF